MDTKLANTKRKLTAILFADIVGHSALMEKDEAAASQSLAKFRQELTEKVANYQGRIVNFYGDGCLTVFESPVQAVECSAAAQQAFQESPVVPVRIGLHSGVVIFEADNVYGDAVNQASRVESMGVAGSVLLSESINKHIKNQKAFQTISLGKFSFKSIEEPMELFALKNPGFVVPKRGEMRGKLREGQQKKSKGKWLLAFAVIALIAVGGFWFWNNSAGKGNLLPNEVREEKVAVAVFNNYTDRADLDAFGNMASDWITSALRQLKVKTSSPEMMRRYKENVGVLPNNPQKEVSLFELTGAKYVVTGSYYQKGDSLQLTSRLESTETGDIVYEFPATWGLQSQKEQLIEELSEKLKGYWAVRRDENLSKINPPKYEAYQVFLDCAGCFHCQDCFEKALAIDSSFMLARVYLAFATQTLQDDTLYKKTRSFIFDHWQQCTKFERNFFNYSESLLRNDYPAALKALNDNLELDPRDIDMLHESAIFYLILNDPQTTVDRYQPLFSQYDIYKDKIFGNMYNAYFDALNRLGRHKEIIDFTADLPVETLQNMGGYSTHEIWRALLMHGDLELMNERLEFFKSKDIWIDYLKLADLYNITFPKDSINIFAQSLRERLDNYSDPKDSWGYMLFSIAHLKNIDSKAFAHYILQEWAQAENILESLRKVDWLNVSEDIILKRVANRLPIWVEGLLGSTYARQGKTELAFKQIEKLEALRQHLPKETMRMRRGANSYFQARIYALMKEKEKAVELLKQAIREGKGFEYESFIYDWDLAGLRGYPPYDELIRPKESLKVPG